MSRRKWFSLTAALVAVLALIGLGGAASAYFPANMGSAAPPAAPAGGDKTDPLANFDCSQIKALGIDKQVGLRASMIMVHCGQAQPGGADVGKGGAPAAKQPARPNAYGGPDVDTISTDGVYPKVVQSESAVWDNGTAILVHYNDSAWYPANNALSDISVSTDGGTTFSRLNPSPFTNTSGDPTVMWNARYSKWVAIAQFDPSCGGSGIRGFYTSNPAGNAGWAAGSCIHNGSNDDRQSSWVDNNPVSPNYGTMIDSFANYNLSGPPISVVRSTDGGVTWSAPQNLAIPSGASFIRNIQDTGAPDGTFFIGGMDEGGGGLNNRRNFIYRSTDGGATWSAPISMGAAFPGPGVATSGYFALMFPTIWRHMGWGQPGAGPNQVVHYVYAQHGAGADAGDVYYVRSTDNGSTWGTPVKMNTDSTTRPQWQPSLAVNAQGSVFVGWYDGRNSASCGSPGANSPCYERWGRASTDNGATWQPDQAVSDVISPLPAQSDPNIQTTYEGDYDYSSAFGNNFYQTWTDGRTIINGTAQQDVYFDKIPLVQGTPTPTVTGTPPTNTPTRTPTITPIPPSATPTPCGPTGNYNIATLTATIVAGTTDTGNHCDDCTSPVTFPFPLTFYGQTYNGGNVSSNGNLQFVSNSTTLGSNCPLPSTAFTGPTIELYQDDLRTDTSGNCPGGCGIWSGVFGTAPNRTYVLEWRTWYFGRSGFSNEEIVFYENDPTRITTVYGATADAGASEGIGVQQGPTGLAAQFSCLTASLTTGLRVDYVLVPCGTPTITRTPVASTPTRTSTVLATATSTVTRTATVAGASATPTQPAVASATATATVCTITFTDVDVTNPFYVYIRCLACRQIVSGYSDGTFRWAVQVTRGQLSKIIANAAGFADAIPSTRQSFQDVPSSNPFWLYIERLFLHNAISGYTCGGAGEPCVPPGNLPYFRWGANATRGQIAKIDAIAAGYNDTIPTTQQTFEDVPSSNPFWLWIEELANRSIISGYTCGGTGEPCQPPGNRPYFRWTADATRGQMAKIAAQTFFPNCQTPAR